MACTGKCRTLKCEGNGRKSSYDNGKKFCKPCHCFFMIDKWFCPCCNKKLRTKSHDNHAREKYRKRRELKVNVNI